MQCISILQLPAFKGLISLLFLLAFCACDTHTTYRSSVPSYPVNIRINTYEGTYVHFVPENSYTYMIVDKDGYHFNGQTMPRKETDRFGYAGVAVYIDGFGTYSAYDMACPYCVNQDEPVVEEPVEVDGMFATCPICGEAYDLGSGYATPKKGISDEALSRYSLIVSNGVITIRN